MMDQEKEFLEAVGSLARLLPSEVLDRLCEILEKLPPDASPILRKNVANTIVQPAARQDVSQLLKKWNTQVPHLSPSAVAWALRAADRADEWHRQRQSVELVWTGPTPQDTTIRRTDQALLHLINVAQRSLWIVTFAAYHVEAVAEALKRAAERNVAITFIAESSEASAGKMAWGAIEALGGALPKTTARYIWPQDKRPKNPSGQFGSLHVKCAVADEQVALISSANLTGHALNLNMELGVLIRGGDVPHDVVTHLRQLIQKDVLTRIQATAT
jgi:phosphatidylserine/phosphatidylglycerophosphate/cardiolipin synthase-like enzyme